MVQLELSLEVASRARAFASAVRGLVKSGALWCAVAFMLSLSIALGWTRVHEAREPGAAARVAVWATDRDAGRVIGLDRDLLVAQSIAVRAPTEVEARPDGGAWVVSSLDADPLGRHQLLRLQFDGTVAARVPLGPSLDLFGDELGRALTVDLDSGAERVALFDAQLALLWQRHWPGAQCAAATPQSCLVGTAQGELLLFDLGSPTSAPLRTSFGGSISDVAPGPRADTWWALDAHGFCRIGLFDAQLGLKWWRNVGLHALHLAPVAQQERLWIADTTQPHVRRFGPAGVLEIDRADLPLGGLDRACGAPGGSALFAAVGALLRLDVQGQNAPGQAGFDFLVDVASVRPN